MLQEKRPLGTEPSQNLVFFFFFNGYLQSAKQPDSNDWKEMCIIAYCLLRPTSTEHYLKYTEIIQNKAIRQPCDRPANV